MSAIFGVFHQDPEVLRKDLLLGTDYHSHMAAELGGLAIALPHEIQPRFWRSIHDISLTSFKDCFESEIFSIENELSRKGKLTRKKSILETRFGVGVISSGNPQPLIIGSRKFGDYVIVGMGLVHNLNELVQEIGGDTPFIEMSNASVNQMELSARLIEQGDDLPSGIKNLWAKIDGSLSILIMNQKEIWAARDRFGVTPLVLAEKEGGWAIATESGAFQNLNYQPTRFLKPGEIVQITESGPKTVVEGNENNCRICAFLWIYTGFPTSTYEGLQVESVRYRCGGILAKRDGISADLVAGIPDSGTGHAIGYANESKIPYKRPCIKYTPSYGRSYTPTRQETRDQIARFKLQVVELIIRGQRIVFLEDSIVRGTQLKDFTIGKLWGAGAKEIHVRPACPPLMFPCRYLLATREISELAARIAIREIEGVDLEDVSAYLNPESKKFRQMVEGVRQKINATTLLYQRLDDMITAIGLPKEKLCLYCWNGQKID